MPGIDQKIRVEKVEIPEATRQELQGAFCPRIYTGREAAGPNLLRDVVGGYLGRPAGIHRCPGKMQSLAVLMEFALERGNIEGLLPICSIQHWELSKQLDAGSTNTCIEQIFMACEDTDRRPFYRGSQRRRFRR